MKGPALMEAAELDRAAPPRHGLRRRPKASLPPARSAHWFRRLRRQQRPRHCPGRSECEGIGIANYQTVTTHTLTDWPDASFDAVLANPPYYAHGSIIRLFIERSKALLRSGGVLYLVTKHVDTAWPLIQEHFVEPEMYENRGYVIFRVVKA